MGRITATFAACAMFSAAIIACGRVDVPQPTPYGVASPTDPPTASATALPADPPRASPAASGPHVFVVVMENTGLDRALASPPIERLAAASMLATNYHAVARPSLPNYLALTSGSTWGITDDAYHVLPAGGLGAQLTSAGISWRAYMEGMTTDGGCLRSPYPYALKHDPFAYYGGACPPNVVPFESLDPDLAAAATPSFVWITPGLCHDGHDCALEVAGAWLTALVTRIEASEAWRTGGTLFIVWDEAGGADDLVPLIVLTPHGASRRDDGRYDHYSLLATIEDLFGLPRLGAAVTARTLLAGGR